MKIQLNEKKWLLYDKELSIKEILVIMNMIKLERSFTYKELATKLKCDIKDAKNKLDLVAKIQIEQISNNNISITNFGVKLHRDIEKVIDFEIHDEINLEALINDLENCTSKF